MFCPCLKSKCSDRHILNRLFNNNHNKIQHKYFSPPLPIPQILIEIVHSSELVSYAHVVHSIIMINFQFSSKKPDFLILVKIRVNDFAPLSELFNRLCDSTYSIYRFNVVYHKRNHLGTQCITFLKKSHPSLYT